MMRGGLSLQEQSNTRSVVMKLFILVLLALAALSCFAFGIALNNLILLATSVCLALAAYLADRRYQAYFELNEFK